ncbi:MAG TPA: hypothetical protein VEX17_00265 [Bacillales bacterium]|nr:hypothetical protein [Bacillales bacterium]
MVIKLAHEGKSTRHIAQLVHISPKDIGTIIRVYNSEEKEAPDKQLSISSRAFKLLKENKSLVDVAITLNLDAWDVLDRFNEYLQLSSKDKLMSMYRELGDDDIQLLEHLYKELKLHGLDNKNDISNIVQQCEKLKNLDNDINKIANIIGMLNFTKMRLERDVNDLMKSIDHYDSVLSDISK